MMTCKIYRKLYTLLLIAALALPTGWALAQNSPTGADSQAAPVEEGAENTAPALTEENLPPADSEETQSAATDNTAPQETAAPPAPVAEKRGLFGQVLNYYELGGMTMHFLLILSIAGLTVILERFWAYRNAKMDPVSFINEIRSALLKDHDIKKAVAACDRHGLRPLANVAKSALLRFDESGEELEKTLENSAVSEVGRLEKFLPVLATVANIAPMFGFLGTVVGMISSFDAIAKFGMTNPNLVAQGISEALITTAAGLMVALFTQPFYNYYSSVVTRFLREMEGASNVLLETHAELQKHPAA